MRHPGTHSQGEPTNPPPCPNSCCCHLSRQGRNDTQREANCSSGRSRTQQKGEARQDGRPCPASMPGHTNNAGSREHCNCQGNYQSATARQSSCIITCRQLQQGGPETKTINIQSISLLFPLCLKFSCAGKRNVLVWRSREQITLLLNKVAGGQDTHHQSQSLLPSQ